MICYGRSIPSIAEQLYGGRDDMTDEQKTKGAQRVFDSVMNSFPGLRNLMTESQEMARQLGYVTTILGRRRHLPDMQLPEFDFKAMPGYVNPDIDPLDINTLSNSAEIPDRIVKQLKKEFAGYKYYGQIAKRTKELHEQNIRVINNRAKINDATRQCVNCVSTDTQILTESGWKYYNEVEKGEKIISYNLDKKSLEEDTVQAVHFYYNVPDVFEMHNLYLSAVCTEDHRWVIDDSVDEKLETFSEIKKRLGVGIIQTSEISVDDMNAKVSETYLQTMHDLGRYCATFLESCPTKYILMSDDLKHLLDSLGGDLTYNFIYNLSPRMRLAILEGLISTHIVEDRFIDISNERLQLIQTLFFLCGRLSRLEFNGFRWVLTIANKGVTKSTITQSNMYISPLRESNVWCVTTGNGTWIAKKDGSMYITGNSRIQGSAADQTKMAILLVDNNPEWKRIGARILAPIHDEVLIEAPIQNSERAGQLLSELMCEAADFLPFPSKCDVETTYRWYGLSAPCEYPRPSDVDTTDPDEVKWIQYHLFESEYVLPVYKDENGDKPKGDAAKGVNGVRSEELESAIASYCERCRIPRTDFLDNIERRVVYGD